MTHVTHQIMTTHLTHFLPDSSIVTKRNISKMYNALQWKPKVEQLLM